MILMCKEDSLSLFITVDVAWKMLKDSRYGN